MEEGRQKKQRTLRNRLRDSFGNRSLPQSLVPLDIWEHTFQIADIKSVSCMAQTSTAFEEIVREKIRTNNWGLALQYRKEGQIRLALWCLKSCVKHGHPHATFHLGYAYHNTGWGVVVNSKKGEKYTKRAIGLGSEYALVLGGKIPQQIQSTNPFILGYVYLYDANAPWQLGIQYLEKAAEEGDEFAQYMLANQYERGVVLPKDSKKALEWYTKSAEQGLIYPMLRIFGYYHNKGNYELYKKWFGRYRAQSGMDLKLKE